jgi:hypothetical protein
MMGSDVKRLEQMLRLEARHRQDLVRLVEAQVIPAIAFKRSMEGCRS